MTHVELRYPKQDPELYSWCVDTYQDSDLQDTRKDISPQSADSDQEDFEETLGSTHTNLETSAVTSSCSPSVDEVFPPEMKAGEPVEHIPFSQVDSSTYFPFLNHSEYKLARFFHRNKVAKSSVADFFKDGLAPTNIVSFQSGHTPFTIALTKWWIHLLRLKVE